MWRQGDRGWTVGSVSALRLPDAPNIMFNDINFLLNGPRFDSRCERVAPAPSFEPQHRTEAGKKYTLGNNLASRVRKEWKKNERDAWEGERGEEGGCRENERKETDTVR